MIPFFYTGSILVMVVLWAAHALAYFDQYRGFRHLYDLRL